MALVDHVQQLIDEEAMWLATPPPDLPAFAMRLYAANMLEARRHAAEGVREEIRDAVKLLRDAGYIV